MCRYSAGFSGGAIRVGVQLASVAVRDVSVFNWLQ